MDAFWDLLPGVDASVLSMIRWPLIGLGVLIFVIVNWSKKSSETTVRQLFGEVAIVVPAYFLYFIVRGVADSKEAQAFHRGIDIIELEQTLGIFWEQDLQSSVLHLDWLINMANWTYIWGHWPVIAFAAIWLFLLHREAYTVYRNAFLITGGIGLVVFFWAPVAPPRFMDAWGFVDTVAERSHAHQVLQHPAFVNQYAAMPSLHFAWNLLVGIAIVRHAENVFVKSIGFVLPCLMFAAIVLTANHYIIDGLAGGLLAVIGLAGALAFHRFNQRDEDVHTGPRWAGATT